MSMGQTPFDSFGDALVVIAAGLLVVAVLLARFEMARKALGRR